MSWDIHICRFSREYASVEEIPANEQCIPLGSRSEVQATISKFFPGTDWSDPEWGIFDSAAGSIEFNLGTSEPKKGFTLHVRASEAVVSSIVKLCKAQSWQALDCSTGGFLERSTDPAKGLVGWATYRNRIIDET